MFWIAVSTGYMIKKLKWMSKGSNCELWSTTAETLKQSDIYTSRAEVVCVGAQATFLVQ